MTSFKVEHDYGAAVSLGMVSGVSSTNITASLIDAPNGSEVIITDAGVYTEETFPFLDDGGESVHIVSTSASDTSDVIMLCEGLDGDGLEVSQVVQLNGVTPVVLDGVWYRITQITTAGDTKHIGEVTVNRVSNGNPIVVSLQSNQRSTSGVYTIPANKRANLKTLLPSMIRDGGADTFNITRLKVRLKGSVFVSQFARALARQGNSSPELNNLLPEVIEPLTDIIMTSEADSAGQQLLVRLAVALYDIKT